MSIQITIIGLGQIGASLGLALAKHKNLIRVGHDKNMANAKAAQKMGAVDKVIRNLPNSVKDADIIILSLPLSEIRETLNYIKEDLKENAAILDTAPGKKVVGSWMQDILPAGRAYIGLAPAINPLYLGEKERGVDAARADLFHKTVTMIAAPPSVSGDALQLAADFVYLYGSQPLFADPTEVDGVTAGVHLLPQLVASALLNTTVDAPGWGEAKKVAGRVYANITEASPKEEEVGSLSEAALSNKENVARILGGMIESLQILQNSIAKGDADTLNELLSRAEDGCEDWWLARRAADWISGESKNEPVALAGISERIFGFRQRKPRD